MERTPKEQPSYQLNYLAGDGLVPVHVEEVEDGSPLLQLLLLHILVHLSATIDIDNSVSR